MAAGSYPAQTLPFDATKTSATDVVFRPAVGAQVSLSQLISGRFNLASSGAKHFEIRDMRINNVQIDRESQDVTLRNLDMGKFFVRAARDVSILGGDVGPWVDDVATIFGCAGCPAPANIVIDGLRFHDFLISDPGNHSECMQIWPSGATNIVVRNSTFQNCTDFAVLVKARNSSGFIFENNFFDRPMPGNVATTTCNPGCPRSGTSLRFSSYPYPGSAVRYNSFLGGLSADRPEGIVLKANISAIVNFVDPLTADGTMNLRLKPGAPAIGAGDPADFPPRDIEGRLRPITFPPDAGAWQREPALVVAGRAIGTATIGMARDDVMAFYGTPRRRTTQKLHDGTKLEVHQHSVRGGRLRVSYRSDRVVAIATTSPYYRTLNGLTPGARMRPRAKDDWTCRPVGAPNGKARLYLLPTRSTSPVVAELTVVAARLLPACASPPNKR